MNQGYRKIIHVDMDAFYASVEQLDNPELRGKAIAVGGVHRGVLTTASYEARTFGIRSAMPTRTALKKCPHLIIVPPRFARYKELSAAIRDIFYEYTDLVEPLSLDEAYLDVTINKKQWDSANLIAATIRQEIKEKIGLTASAGISINKFLAKVASDINKPDGQKTIHPTEVLSFLEQLPIDKFYGVGKVTAGKMKKFGINNGKELKMKSLQELIKLFGKNGYYFYQVVRGIHSSEVNPNRIRKSIAVEETYQADIEDEIVVLDKLKGLVEELVIRLNKYQLKGRTLTLKIKYGDFSNCVRSHTVSYLLYREEEIFHLTQILWEQRSADIPIRLLGLSMSNLNNEYANDGGFSEQLVLPFE